MATNDIRINGRSGPDADGPLDRMGALICQLDAATAVICAGGFAAFSELNSEIRDNYLWMLHDLAARLRFAHTEHIRQALSDRFPTDSSPAPGAQP
jgi:hypothetical protein